MTNRRRLVAAVSTVVLLLAACGSDDDDTASSTGADESASPTSAIDTTDTTSDSASGGEGEGDSCTAERVGGDITVFTNYAVSGIDLALLSGTGARGGHVAAAFFGTVIRYDPATASYEPNIAASWESNDDSTVWTLTLRDDVTFGNGDPFTTAHIAAHLERMKDSAVPAAGMAELVSDIEIVNDYEMEVRLQAPFDFRYMMAADLGWVPNKELVEQRGDRFHVNPVGGGAGAFEVQSVSDVPGESLVMTAKDDWWGGPVCLQRIDFRYVEGTEAAADAFQNGEADSFFVGDQEVAARLDEAGLMVHQLPVGGVGWVVANQGFDGAETEFSDVRIREAMQLAIDYDAIYERMFDGVGPAPSSAMMPESSPLWSGVEGPPYDPERAAELVQKTIDEGVWDGAFTFTHSTRPELAELPVLLEGMWEAVGMEVTLDPAPDALARVVGQDFEVGSLGFNLAPPSPWRSLSALRSDSARQRAGFSDPEMDAAIQELQGATSLEENREILGEIQEIWNETFPLVVWRHGTWGIAAQPDLHGIEVGADVTPLYEDAWIE